MRRFVNGGMPRRWYRTIAVTAVTLGSVFMTPTTSAVDAQPAPTSVAEPAPIFDAEPVRLPRSALDQVPLPEGAPTSLPAQVGTQALTCPYIGTWVISNILGRVADVQGGNTADRTPVILYRYHGSSNQQWRFYECEIPHAAFVYILQNVKSGKCLDASADKDPANGTRVYIYSCNQQPQQLWEWQYRPWDGYYNILNWRDFRCLDIANGGNFDYNLLWMYTCHNAWNQAWDIR